LYQAKNAGGLVPPALFSRKKSLLRFPNSMSPQHRITRGCVFEHETSRNHRNRSNGSCGL
jgi:hypothetical protein